MSMKAVKIYKANEVSIENIQKPLPEKNEVLIKVMASGICGTDIHIFRGRYIGDYPVIPGHEFSGIVEEIGNNVTKFNTGDRVAVEPNISCNNCYNCLNNRQNFCLNWQAVGLTRPGGMAQYVAAPEQNTFDIGDIPFEAGALVEPLSCIIHSLQKINFSLGDKVAIFGAGPIGLLMLQIIKKIGAVEVSIVDKNKTRIKLAERYGADISLTNFQILKKDHYDVVVDATGAISVMRKTLDFVRYGGTVLLFGVPPIGKSMEIEPFIIFKKGLTIFSSYTSVRNSYQAIDLLKSGELHVKDLISHRLQLEEFQRGIDIIENVAENVKKVMILPNM